MDNQLVPVEIGHADFIAVVNPQTAFWALSRKSDLADNLSNNKLTDLFREKADEFAEEMQMLRFGLKPSAVYVNPTELCNLDCSYCYIPAEMRRSGEHMSTERLLEAMARLKDYFSQTIDDGRKPQIIFHGAEPLLNKTAVFAAIDQYKDEFGFGVQTNATSLDDKAIEFLTARGVSIGLSLDGPIAEITDRTRLSWGGKGVHNTVLKAIEKLRGYPAFSVITTATRENMTHLKAMVELFHEMEVPTCMLNQVRCTLSGAREVKPDDQDLARHLIEAMERSYELYQETGRKLVVANFANILLAILAPTARRLMCDISPCGGGRAFFAMAPNGDLFPCSEFIGLPKFNGGNLFKDAIPDVLKTESFRLVSERNVDTFEPCSGCAIKHFCGSPCPAEAHEINGSMEGTGAFCEFYKEQARYAFRLIADGKADAFLWDGWDDGIETSLDVMLR
jgi:uncharacterized protein